MMVSKESCKRNATRCKGEGGGGGGGGGVGWEPVKLLPGNHGCRCHVVSFTKEDNVHCPFPDQSKQVGYAPIHTWKPGDKGIKMVSALIYFLRACDKHSFFVPFLSLSPHSLHFSYPSFSSSFIQLYYYTYYYYSPNGTTRRAHCLLFNIMRATVQPKVID